MKVDEVKQASELKKKSGIYLIRCIPVAKGYIGSSRNLHERINFHLSRLRHNKHVNNYLQNAWNKYEKSDFEVIIVEYCSKELLFEKEQFYVNLYETSSRLNGYNLACVEKGNDSYVPFPDDKRLKENLDPLTLANKKEKLSQASKEQWSDPVNRHKMSEIKKDQYENNPELKDKISEATTKAMNTTEIKEKIGNGVKNFNLENPERYKEIKAAQKATLSSDEHRQKASVIAKELWQDPNHREKVLNARKDMYTDEVKAKMAKKSQAFWDDPVKAKELIIKRSNITQEQFEQLRNLHKLGYNYGQIAKVLNCKRSTVARICRGQSLLYSLV